jgi:hypothetical protein
LHSQSPCAVWRIVWFQSGVPLPAHKFPWNLSVNHEFHGLCGSIHQLLVCVCCCCGGAKMRTWVLATRFDQQSFGFFILNSSSWDYRQPAPQVRWLPQPVEIWGKRVLVVVPVLSYYPRREYSPIYISKI